MLTVRALELNAHHCCVIQIQTCHGMFLRSLEQNKCAEYLSMVALQPLDIKIEDSGLAVQFVLLWSRAFPGLDHWDLFVCLLCFFVLFCFFLLTGTCSSNLYRLTPEAIPSFVGEVEMSSQRACCCF